MKNAPTSGTTRNAFADGPNSRVTASMLAMAISNQPARNDSDEQLDRHGAKSVGETLWNVKLAMLLRGQGHTHPFAECRGPSPDIDSYIKDFSLNNPNKFSLWPAQLVMQASKHTSAGRIGKIILDEC